MNKRSNNLIMIILLIVFFFLFRFNASVKECVINAIMAWLYNLVPFMFTAYLLIDLLQNYGLSNIIYHIFKNNIPIIVLESLLLGSPSNAKYIKDYYQNGYIKIDTANYLLTFAYSPNPLFIMGIAGKDLTIKTLLFIYITNLILALIFRKINSKNKNVKKITLQKPFVTVLETSIYKTFRILILILGIIIIYAIINLILDTVLDGPNFIIKSTLEITNALILMKKTNNFNWLLFACSFGGLSIHTQIKSILDDTPISYKYFFYGRVIASIFALLFTFIF